jgi:putative redox protein
MDITVDFPGGARVDAHWDSFTVLTDQPKNVGGDNSAPGPFALFLASLATCAGYYVFSFCKKRGIPMEGIKLIQKMEEDPKTKMVGKISVEIQLPADFPKEYASAVIRAAESCLVKKHLEHPPSFEVFTSVAAVATQ